MSPLESAKVLPCSEESSRARLSNSFCTSSRNLNITRARRCGLVAAQAGCAASALAIACSMSALLAKATLACTSPVLGSNTSPLRPELPATVFPPMKWPISRMGVLPRLHARMEEPLSSSGRRLPDSERSDCRYQIAQLAPRRKPPGGASAAHRLSAMPAPSVARGPRHRRALLAILSFCCSDPDVGKGSIHEAGYAPDTKG